MGKLIKVDVSGIKETIKEMEIYKETKKVIEQYEEEKAQIEARKQEIEKRMEHLQKALTENMLACEVYKSEPSTVVNLKHEQKVIKTDLEILASMLDEIEEEYTALKLKFAPIYRQAGTKEKGRHISITEEIEEAKYIMLTSIAELSAEMIRQHREVEEALMEVYNDETVQERLKYPLVRHGQSPKPTFSYAMNDVIHRGDVFSAIDGYIKMSKPKSLIEAEKAKREVQEVAPEVKEDEGK
ncbi:hypothetical protein [Priestia aryabhattai]|uniref:hypothetical protein n=1 Tax=Priestia aryabhattai TaxID=412384 RepID=UPI003D2A67B6